MFSQCLRRHYGDCECEEGSSHSWHVSDCFLGPHSIITLCYKIIFREQLAISRGRIWVILTCLVVKVNVWRSEPTRILMSACIWERSFNSFNFHCCLLSSWRPSSWMLLLILNSCNFFSKTNTLTSSLWASLSPIDGTIFLLNIFYGWRNCAKWHKCQFYFSF